MPILDCLIIGGGPAGLTAALYLGRFKRRVEVIDGGWSRAEWITLSHNIPGFPEGISGPTYYDRLRQQAQRYGCTPEKGYCAHPTLARRKRMSRRDRGSNDLGAGGISRNRRGRERRPCRRWPMPLSVV